ncbi:MAG: glycosyltransferase [Erysipelotrichaceae bacterium]|nr:glycosyltransferase [Erysipelotrichaceae bacterium]
MKKHIALVPSFEPDDKLLGVIKDLQKFDFEIVVVNDGSGPQFDEIFAKLPQEVTYLSYEKNHGKGYALKHGFSYIFEHFKEDSTIVTLDSDGQHKAEDAYKITLECDKKQNTMVIGSRYFDKKAPLRSRIGNFLARTTFSLSTHHRIYDTQTGLRAFSSSLLKLLINTKGERYEYEMNVLLSAVRHKIQIEEVKIATIYIDNNSGSHYNPLKDSVRIFKEVLKFSVSSLIGFLVDYSIFSLLNSIKVDWVYWLIACNVIARVISASVNFAINYKFVFQSNTKLWKAILKYVALAIFILGCDTLLLWLLVEYAHLNEYGAKAIVEVIMFTLSWVIQRLFVFRKRIK